MKDAADMRNNETSGGSNWGVEAFLTCEQVAQILGVSESTLSTWRRTGRGPIKPAINEARTIRYARADIEHLAGATNECA